MLGRSRRNNGQERLRGTALIGPFALALLINAGQLKTSRLFAWFPTDLTVFALLVVLLCCAFQVVQRGLRDPALVFIVAMLLSLSLSTSNLASTAYGASKASVLFTITATLMVAPFVLLVDRRQMLAFFVTLVVIAGIVTFMVWLEPEAVSEYTDRLSFDGANTIGTARIAGAGAVVCAVLATARELAGRSRLLLTLATVTFLGVIVASGSRGPAVAVVIAIASVLVFSPSLRRFRGRAITISVVAIGGVGWWLLSSGGDGGRRILGLIAGEGDRSSSIRVYLWEQSLSAIASNGAGVGLGAFGEIGSGVSSVARYPHNLILEVFVEGGWLPGSVIVVTLIVAISRAIKNSTEPIGAIAFALLVFALANAMVSGDINDGRLLWVMVTVALMRHIPPAEHGTAHMHEPVSRRTLHR